MAVGVPVALQLEHASEPQPLTVAGAWQLAPARSFTRGLQRCCQPREHALVCSTDNANLCSEAVPGLPGIN